MTPTIDPATGLPFSSRHVAECLRRGAERFGWAKRSMAPQSMRAQDGTEIGWGVAIGAYPGLIVPAIAHLKVTDDGGCCHQRRRPRDGTGHPHRARATPSAASSVFPPEQVSAVIGDTRAAPQHLTAGSWGTASAIPAAEDAATRC